MSKAASIEQILAYAETMGATDIHIICGAPPCIRVNKDLYDIPDTDILDTETCYGYACEIMSNRNKQELQTVGQADFSFGLGDARYRCNVFMQRGSVSLALRRIPKKIPNFDELRIPAVIKKFADLHKGLVLVTGATGSGKSTTLASLIDIVNTTRKKHIITIEDPIEYMHNHKLCRINQREVGSDTDSFSNALRAALREDPDIILVGEMRDPETINIALTAAETGHLVFSTLHTVGAPKTLDRIVDSFSAERQVQIRNQLSTVLKGIVSQELLPSYNKDSIVPACEVMMVNPAIANLIREGKSHQIYSIMQGSVAEGMQTMDNVLADLVNRKLVSFEEAYARALDRKLFQQLATVR
ncbi:twitching motility protein PilT [Hathewaya proteolytica DSM 3090]|uniref:Twitching motility protein PilT n=1 Tax=Hathewaya proteolytica DSM 3090 TaxID=1121331 RepID=A0A1M6LHZ0_9CLOT|nr:type IV pilus twitching motility protein PilT [Hathewaya proteolytica]SHJ70829.1 twitching motility protein PilT [Hathewaya proteolytica DSM 3090]